MEVPQVAQCQQVAQGGQQYEPGKIFVGGLSWDTNEETLRGHFQNFGVVKECVVMREQGQPTSLRKNRGFGFVTFEDPTVVPQVLAIRQHVVDGKTVDPKAAVMKGTTVSGGGGGSGDHRKKAFLGGLASQTTEQEVRNYFESRYGVVKEIDFKTDKETDRLRGFGFVGFESEEVRNKVVADHYHEICGKRVEAKKAEPRGANAGSVQQMPSMPIPYTHYPYHPQAGATNGQYQQYYGAGAGGQYYGYQQQSGYGQQYNTGGSYQYDHSGYGRTQTSAGDRSADPHQSYYHTQHTYGHSGAAQQMSTAYTQDSGAYGRSGYPSTQDTAYTQQMTGYGQTAPQQQQQQPHQAHHYGGGAGAAGSYGH